MSMHKIPLTALEESGLKARGLDVKLREALIHHQKLTRPIEKSIEALAIPSDTTALNELITKAGGAELAFVTGTKK